MSPYITEERPWGRFTILYETDTYKVKEVLVKPGARLSYQTHAKRSEHWIVVQSSARVILDDQEFLLTEGQSLDVPVGAKHRVGNAGAKDLIFIEVQRGSYLGEDDIVRLADDYYRI